MTPEKYIKEAVDKSPKPTFFEIGAARLEDTEAILNLIVSGGKLYDYYAFEPDPRNLEWARSNPVAQLVNLVPVAIGGEIGYADFHQSSGKNPTYGYEHTLSGSLKKPKLHLQVHPWCKFDSVIKVRQVTLDGFCHLFSIPTIDFIWCDVQGAEDAVISGGREMFQNVRFLYTEYYETEMYEGQRGIAAMLEMLGAGWKVGEVWPNDVLFRNTRFQ
jgi:FkbM family methyltransferase